MSREEVPISVALVDLAQAAAAAEKDSEVETVAADKCLQRYS